jgi:hypothetical protein
MSDRAQNRLLTILGIITAAITIGVQWMSLGEIKGKLETVVNMHDRRLDAAEGKIDDHAKDIAEIKGKLHGIASQVGKVPGRVAERIQGQ